MVAMLTFFYQWNSDSKSAQLNYTIVVNMMIEQADTLIKLESTPGADLIFWCEQN